jgi:hypothetical protein
MLEIMETNYPFWIVREENNKPVIGPCVIYRVRYVESDMFESRSCIFNGDFRDKDECQEYLDYLATLEKLPFPYAPCTVGQWG